MKTTINHTAGKAIAHTDNNSEYIDIDVNDMRLCSLFIGDDEEEMNEEQKKNADRLVKCWNEHDKLKEENEFLRKELAKLENFVSSLGIEHL